MMRCKSSIQKPFYINLIKYQKNSFLVITEISEAEKAGIERRGK